MDFDAGLRGNEFCGSRGGVALYAGLGFCNFEVHRGWQFDFKRLIAVKS